MRCKPQLQFPFEGTVVNAETSYLDKTFWKDMHGEAPEELNAIECHRFF